ncbi:MAG: PD-(D/E)XK nuclease family protein [Mogibacterium sp.]|nr:PD-(D/E)XK nuclease family protein [Mogibacterium sp.]
MLNLFAAREITDKERFIYEHVRGETFVLVPNQYTLVAEEQALRHMGVDCLFDVEILSMNRLGLRMLTEQGLESVTMLDKYGRFMLLSKLVREHIDDFDIFRRSAGKLTFTSMLNDFISEFKQQDCSLEEIASMLEGDDTDPLLKAKLEELRGVIEAYEEAIKGKYTDSEDYISMYVDAIRESELIKGKTIWIYGYDSITPKFTSAMLELALKADSVNFIVNQSDFDLDEQLVRMLRRMGEEKGIKVHYEEIGKEYELPKSETIRRIERGLWKDTLSESEIADNSSFFPEDLTVVSAANPYYEAESAAVYIWHLIRDLGYKMREIQVIANDEGVMQPIIRRVFDEYGLPVFMDSSRNITDTAAVSFIVNLLWFVVHRRASDHLFAMLKTGLAGTDDSVTEDLENYVRNYHIRGTMWDKPFKYGEETIGTETFALIENARGEIMSKVSVLDELFRTGTIGEFVPAFKAYLRDVWGLEDKVASAVNEEEELGLNDEAQRNIQSYAKAIGMLDQIVEIMGESELDPAEFTDIYVSGLTGVEVGVIPPAADGLAVGTMIRTRPRPVRAAVILGANEGTLPLSPSPEGLFSVDEKEYFRQKGFALGSLDDIKMNEENAAMYRMMAKPSEKLYISWAATDADGNDLSASPVIESLLTLFPRLREDGLVRKDVISEGWGTELIETPGESLRHLMGRLKDRNLTEVDALTRALLKWYHVNSPSELAFMLKAASDENVPAPLGSSIAGRLFGRADGSLVLSASAISGYFDCPFKYFVDRGLRPREERDFSGDSRSIGDAYHECLMRVAQRVIKDKALLASAADDDEEIEKLVSEELDRIAGEYRGGLFVSTGNEKYRMDRIREICAGAAKALIRQLSAESVNDAAFEESFGRKARFKPIHFKVEDRDVYVEGKIDRSDFLDVAGEERVRIIDYKTGSDSLNLWKMRHGYKMQLMIYMISASGDHEPAGIFYFNIKDPIESLDGKSEKQASQIMDRDPGDVYKLKGKYIDEPGVLSSMPAEVLGGGRSDSDRKISREEYEEVRQDVLDRIEETAEGILKGTIDIRPLKEGRGLVCTYCSFRPICRQDREYPRTRGREIPPQPKPKKEQEDKCQ